MTLNFTRVRPIHKRCTVSASEPIQTRCNVTPLRRCYNPNPANLWLVSHRCGDRKDIRKEYGGVNSLVPSLESSGGPGMADFGHVVRAGVRFDTFAIDGIGLHVAQDAGFGVRITDGTDLEHFLRGSNCP